MKIKNLDQIIDNADITAIISKRIPLKRAGASLKALCPFHGEKSASFVVTPAKKLWYCFGCQKGGNALTFIQEFDHREFRDAVETLAHESCQTIEWDKSDSSYQAGLGQPSRQDLYSACRSAAAHYHKTLKEQVLAMNYLHKRGFTDEMISKYQLGYASGSSVKDCGAPVEHLVQAGIVGLPKPESKDQTPYDPIAGRIIIPLFDTSWRLCGFTGRLINVQSAEGDPLANLAPKYKNTRETSIFRKSSILYGYDHACTLMRREKKRSLYLIEGQLKTIACLEVGIPACSPGGTGLSDQQMAAIVNFEADTIYLIPDNDLPGTDATIASAKKLRGIEITPQIARLVIPPEMSGKKIDPDDLMAKGIPIEFEHLNFVDWLLQVHCPSRDYRHPESASRIERYILPIIEAHPSPIMRQAERELLSRLTGLHSAAAPRSKSQISNLKSEIRPAAQADRSMNPMRYLCASLINIPVPSLTDPDGSLWWPRHIPWQDTPTPVLSRLQTVYKLHDVTLRSGRTSVIPSIEDLGHPVAGQIMWLCSEPIPPATPESLPELVANAISYQKILKQKGVEK